MRSSTVASLSMLALLGSAPLAAAAPVPFNVALSGDQEVPPVQTAASGVAHFSYDADTRVLTWSVQTMGLAGPVSMAHLHGPAAAGANAAPEIWLVPKGERVANPAGGSIILTPPQAAALASRQLYVNLHTAAHPSGELRGQVVPPAAAAQP